MLLAPRGWRVRSLDWRLNQPGFDLSYGKLICLATPMSSDRTKQICLWMTIDIYIYIYIYTWKRSCYNGCHRRKWTRYPEFKLRTRLHFAWKSDESVALPHMQPYGGVMVSKLDLQTYTSEFESHWVPLSCGLVPHLSKKLSKFPHMQPYTYLTQ